MANDTENQEQVNEIFQHFLEDPINNVVHVKDIGFKRYFLSHPNQSLQITQKYFEKSMNDWNGNRFNAERALLNLVSEVAADYFPFIRSVFTNHPDSRIRSLIICHLLNDNQYGNSFTKELLVNENLDNSQIILDLDKFLSFENDDELFNKLINLTKVFEFLEEHANDNDPEIKESIFRVFINFNYKIEEYVELALIDNNIRLKEIGIRGLEKLGNSDNLVNLISVAIVFSHISVIQKIRNVVINKRNSIDFKVLITNIVSYEYLNGYSKKSVSIMPDLISDIFSRIFEIYPDIYMFSIEHLTITAIKNKNNSRNKIIQILQRINKDDFILQLDELSKKYPKEVTEIFNLIGQKREIDIVDLANLDPKDIQGNAAFQIKKLEEFYDIGLQHTNTSFFWGIAFSIIGILAILFSIIALFIYSMENIIGLFSVIGGVISEFIGGTILLLYKQSREQVSFYQTQLHQIQKYLLANSIIESISEINRDDARKLLIQEMAKVKEL